MANRPPLDRRQLLQLAALAAGGAAAAWLLRRSAPLGRDVTRVAATRDISADPTVPALVPPDADLPLAVFSDYRCPACRLAYPAMRAAVARDGRVRLLFLDWPVFGGVSVLAARTALAAGWQGRYEALHHRLMTDPRVLDEAVLDDIAAAAGVDRPRLAADLTAHAAAIDRRLALTGHQALELGLPGTPGYLIGPLLVAGAMEESEFTRAFAQARAMPAISPAPAAA